MRTSHRKRTSITVLLRHKTFNGNFASLKVSDVSVLTSLPSTANFTTLTVSNNTVATQAWVTSQSYQPLIAAGTYLTALPSTASFTSLTVSNNTVATQT